MLSRVSPTDADDAGALVAWSSLASHVMRMIAACSYGSSHYVGMVEA